MQDRKDKLIFQPVILVGGKGKRFGKDKALLEVNSEPILLRTFRILSAVFKKEPLIIGRMALHGFNPIRDLIKGAGPIGGLYTALMSSDANFIFLTACDMPFINENLLSYMLNHVSCDMDVYIPRFDGLIEPLFAFYNRSLLEPMKRVVFSGRYPVREVLKYGNVRYIEKDEISKFDPEFLTFFNINTKEDYQKVSCSSKLLHQK